MYIPKRYGESKIETCPFCGKQSLTENKEGIPVCLQHKNESLKDMRCLCGEYLVTKKGKYGAFFICIKCGPMNLKKALEINEDRKSNKTSQTQAKQTTQAPQIQSTPTPQYNIQRPSKPNDPPKKFVPKVFEVRSDDPRYFD
jgi:RNA polymerase subunit RPABC4/transcription elongation factor Spt4